MFSKESSLQRLGVPPQTDRHYSIIKNAPILDDRKVSRFVAAPPKPFKQSIELSNKYLLNNIDASQLKDEVYIPPDDETYSEDNDYVDNTLGVKRLNSNSTKSLIMAVPQ